MSARERQIDSRLAELHRKRAGIDAEIAELFARRSDDAPLPRRSKNVTLPAELPSEEVTETVMKNLGRKGIRA